MFNFYKRSYIWSLAGRFAEARDTPVDHHCISRTQKYGLFAGNPTAQVYSSKAEHSLQDLQRLKAPGHHSTPASQERHIPL
jgi:hypothetical protein